MSTSVCRLYFHWIGKAVAFRSHGKEYLRILAVQAACRIPIPTWESARIAWGEGPWQFKSRPPIATRACAEDNYAVGHPEIKICFRCMLASTLELLRAEV
jgi:hypothetical protein